MWQDKLDCYQKQCQVISDAKDLDFVSGGSSRELAIELELELIKWIVHFFLLGKCAEELHKITEWMACTVS